MMNIPGFAAEAALYKGSTHYPLAMEEADGHQAVTPSSTFCTSCHAVRFDPVHDQYCGFQWCCRSWALGWICGQQPCCYPVPK